MVTIEKVGSGRYFNTETGLVTGGDRADVSDDTAAYLCDERAVFRRVEDGADVSENDADSLDDLTKEELYDMATERDIEGRSSMTKAELHDALQEE